MALDFDPRGDGAAFIRCTSETCPCQQQPDKRDPLKIAPAPGRKTKTKETDAPRDVLGSDRTGVG